MAENGQEAQVEKAARMKQQLCGNATTLLDSCVGDAMRACSREWNLEVPWENRLCLRQYLILQHVGLGEGSGRRSCSMECYLFFGVTQNKMKPGEKSLQVGFIRNCLEVGWVVFQSQTDSKVL